jgi:hypothetical protein
MIHLNKQKQEEVKGFLEWLQREIGAKIDGLTNKTTLKQYRTVDFTKFLTRSQCPR